MKYVKKPADKSFNLSYPKVNTFLFKMSNPLKTTIFTHQNQSVMILTCQIMTERF